MSDQKKLRKLEVVGDDGKKRFFKFQPMLKELSEEQLVCDYCSYSEICDKIKNPKALNDADSTFEDFCSELGELENPENLNLFPVQGSLEEGFKEDFDIFQELIKYNPTIRVNDLIESVCATGWCEDYSEDHCNCSANNKSCLLYDLFIKIKTTD
jgi:hypothetical protein